MSVSFPNQHRNYCIISLPRRHSIEEIESTLKTPNSEEEVLESLYELNILLDEGNKEIPKLYPILSKYNNSTSPNIQTFLAGIYRKTKIPDAFGPLISMLIKNSITPPQNCSFDPNEEIGGAILEYLA